MTCIVSKEGLIISKLDWANDSRSELQLRDVKNLVATGCDGEYVDHWAKALGLSGLWRECERERHLTGHRESDASDA